MTAQQAVTVNFFCADVLHSAMAIQISAATGGGLDSLCGYLIVLSGYLIWQEPCRRIRHEDAAKSFPTGALDAREKRNQSRNARTWIIRSARIYAGSGRAGMRSGFLASESRF